MSYLNINKFEFKDRNIGLSWFSEHITGEQEKKIMAESNISVGDFYR